MKFFIYILVICAAVSNSLNARASEAAQLKFEAGPFTLQNLKEKNSNPLTISYYFSKGKKVGALQSTHAPDQNENQLKALLHQTYRVAGYCVVKLFLDTWKLPKGTYWFLNDALDFSFNLGSLMQGGSIIYPDPQDPTHQRMIQTKYELSSSFWVEPSVELEMKEYYNHTQFKVAANVSAIDCKIEGEKDNDNISMEITSKDDLLKSAFGNAITL